MQKRAVLLGRLSFVHTVYPIFKVHSTDFFSNIFFFQRPLTRGEEISQSALFVRVFKHVSSAQTILRPSSATSALADVSFALFVHYGLSAPFGSMEWHCLSISFSFPPVIPSHKTPRDDREITERWATQNCCEFWPKFAIFPPHSISPYYPSLCKFFWHSV